MIYVYIAIIVVVVLVIYIISVRNSLVVARNKVKDQWSQIDVQLKRRFDMIPNLVETVKGYAKHEKDTLEDIIKARNSYLSAKVPDEQMKANGELTGAISKLFALAESYPDLKANENFLQFQSDLKETEDKISYARQFYNDSVLMYNNKCELFPSNIVASMFHFTKENFFEASDVEKENVNVKF
ncbi:MAG: LemA family protein [Mollicutes bacterium]|nr:LemA family protein [Mollicutes bacterium]